MKLWLVLNVDYNEPEDEWADQGEPCAHIYGVFSTEDKAKEVAKKNSYAYVKELECDQLGHLMVA